MKEIKYKDCQNLIRKNAWYYSKKYGIDFEDVEAQGNLIYVESLQKFDSNRGVSFFAYLKSCLRALGHNYALLKSNVYRNEYGVDNIENQAVSYSMDKFISVLEFYDVLNCELSEQAKSICKFILSGYKGVKVLKRKNIKPSMSLICAYYIKKKILTETTFKKAWQELKEWWISYPELSWT